MGFQDQFLDEHAGIDPAELLDGLLRVSQIIRLHLNDWLGQYELTDGRHSVLMALSQADVGGCSQAQLAEQIALSESNISTLIERMQRDGLVSRSKSESDRRKRILRITSAGRSVLQSVDANRPAWAGRLLNGIRIDERTNLLRLLVRLKSSLEQPADRPAISVHFSAADMDSGQNGPLLNDPHSPQFALRQMLKALSSSASSDSRAKDAA